MTDRDGKDPHPGDPTEEFLLGALDEEAQPLPEKPEPAAQQPVEPEVPAAPEAPAEPVAQVQPEAGDDQAAATPEPGEYVEQPTEEVFALEARLLEGDDVPALDPVFRAALLESPESAAAPDHSGETGEYTSEHDVPASGEHDVGAGPPTTDEPLTGEESPETGDHAEGTEEWDLPSEGEITAEQTAILSATAKSEVNQAIETARRTGEPWDPRRPSTAGDFEPPAKRRRYWWRFALATLIIVFSFAGATSASIMHVVNDIADDIGTDEFRDIPTSILPDSNGGPQTIAILGSDVRTGGGTPEGDPGRSDTAILLRLDPESGQIAMLSIPRDLKVEIPGFGTDKFNAAFSYGGTKLTLKTIRDLTGLDINHVINVDFQGFAQAIDAIGCVFVDVDRDYFNDNSQGGEGYAAIDIDAGYQKLCGPDALEFARYRHADTDLVRAARQQDLIGEVRNRLSFSEVIKRRNELLKSFSENTRSDIDGSKEMLELIKLLFDSKNASVVEVSFPSTFTYENEISYVEATPDEIEVAVDQFLGFEDQTGAVGTLDEGDGARNKAQDAAARKARKKAQKETEDKNQIPSKESDGLVDASIGGQEVAAGLDAEIKRSKQFAVFYPKRLPGGTIYAEGSRRYGIRDLDKNPHAAYRLVMALQLDDGLHYFGLQGIYGWEDPPILEAPHEELEMDDRDFRVYYEGDRIRLIAWFEDGNTYWISNSLLLTLENEQMLGMARSTRAFTAG